MTDKIIVIDDDKPAPPPEVIMVTPKPKVEKVVTEKTTIVESKED